VSICPHCGTKAPIEAMSGPTYLAKNSQKNTQPHFLTRELICSECGTRYNAITKPAGGQTANVKNAFERIKYVREGLMQTIRALREKVQALESEKVNLTNEIEKLKKVAETRVNALEIEVNQMREEAKSLREFLASNEKTSIPKLPNGPV
jgi:uncharacterized Zn finger protein (UPF0148 family)